MFLRVREGILSRIDARSLILSVEKFGWENVLSIDKRCKLVRHCKFALWQNVAK